MPRLLVALLLVCVFAGMASAQGSVDDALAQRVNKALKHLADTQDADGSWRLGTTKSVAATSLAVMAFLSAGHVPGEGKYGDLIEKGVRWVADHQHPDGVVAENNASIVMYHHGISTLMLAEAAGMTSLKLAPQLKQVVEKAVKLILKAQRLDGPHRGGWRYYVTGQDADLSVTGWQLLALKAAKNLGCDVPAERIQMALTYIKASQDKASGGFHYTIGSQITAPCTATAILCLELCEGHHTTAAKAGGKYLLQHPPEWNSPYFFYHVYYAAQASFQLGGNYWEFYRPRLHKLLFEQQLANGSWVHPQESYNGPTYSTAMAVLALTVEYRFLPIYQRGDD